MPTLLGAKAAGLTVYGGANAPCERTQINALGTGVLGIGRAETHARGPTKAIDVQPTAP